MRKSSHSEQLAPQPKHLLPREEQIRDEADANEDRQRRRSSSAVFTMSSSEPAAHTMIRISRAALRGLASEAGSSSPRYSSLHFFPSELVVRIRILYCDAAVELFT